MSKTTATCCLISAHVGTNLARFPTPIKCAHCNEQYSIEYSPAEAAGIPNYERKVRDAAQIKINTDHPPLSVIEQRSHTTCIQIERI